MYVSGKSQQDDSFRLFRVISEMHFICTLVGKRLIYVAKMNTFHNLPQIMCVQPLVVTMFLLFHFL